MADPFDDLDSSFSASQLGFGVGSVGVGEGDDGLDGQQVLDEEHDENYEPTPDDIEAHAEELEADLTKYPQLKDLVVGCLKAKLPPGWKPVKDENSDEMYYFNFEPTRPAGPTRAMTCIA
eukprot:m.14470 g.14470  ORF g.14470 m.14470 type:complete len:120 (+) comp8380_c0_seq1:2-361(+)